ncbi:MAG TPA: indolepyruvate oxidoreductase subunit beta [Syntrophales bacterium]|nr:indolepyruvate oxidoreductase subunit beta [Syntrophales bacterium]HOX93625.1 indolepyruvate oxidoreductase subunit beta [Syntrophales bacterium]HPN25536.1 indolepyruvate oxidoreductase subunit beta [Syntrophales bacterium]
MSAIPLAKDPYNIIITGVGGQGNVLASRILGGVLASKGYLITIGETFGVTQRGGSVMSHVRVSGKTVASPQIPGNMADVIVSLEPAEAVRVMVAYGNPDTVILSNTQPIHPPGVITGELDYPPVDEIKEAVKGIVRTFLFLNATERARFLGNPILANIVMLGALAGLAVVPFDRDDFKQALALRMSPDQVPINLKAFDEGYEMVKA